MRGERGDSGSGQPVTARHVHREQLAARAGRDAGGTTDQGVALGSAGQRDDDPLLGFPGAGDAVLGPVALHALFDRVGQPEQREFAKRREVADAEVVAQRGVDPLGRVDVAVRHPPPQRLGRHVDELDLFGGAHERVGHALTLRHTGDVGDDVVERFQVLDVERRDHVDAGVEDGLDVVPPALVRPRAGHVGVGQLVDQRDRRPPFQDAGEVEFGERAPPVRHLQSIEHRQPVEPRRGVRTSVGLGDRDDDVGAPVEAALPLVEHGDGLAHPRRRTEVDPQRAASHAADASPRPRRARWPCRVRPR